MRILTFFIIMLSGLNFSTYGQKAKIEKVLVKQLHLPSNPFPSNIKTFAVDFNSKFDRLANYKVTTLCIKGFEHVLIEEADIVIKLELKDDKTVIKSKRKVTTTTSKTSSHRR